MPPTGCPSAQELHQMLADASSSNNAVQASVTQRLDQLHHLRPQAKAEAVSVFIAALADAAAPHTTRRLAGSIARQLVQGKAGAEGGDDSAAAAAKIPLPVHAVEEALLLAVSDSDRGVRAAGAWCLAAFAKREFSNHGTGWPTLPGKLRQLATAGTEAFAVGAATALALVAEDCGVQIVQAASDAAATLREQLLELVVAFIDGSVGDGGPVTRRKAIAAATHFVRAATAPAVDLDDFDEDGEIHPEAEGRHVIGREQMKLLVASLAPRFVSFFEATIAHFGEGGPAALAGAVGSSSDEVEAACARWVELGVAVDGINVMMSFEDAIAPQLAAAVHSTAALFCIAAAAAEGADLSVRPGMEEALHGFGVHVLTLLTDVVIANDEGTDSVRHIDTDVAEATRQAVAAVTGRPTLSAAFYAAVLRFGTRMTADELAETTVGADAHLPDASDEVNFRSAALRANHQVDDEDAEPSDDGVGSAADSTGPGANGLSGLRNSATWLLSTMGTTMGPEMLDALVPELQAAMHGALERVGPSAGAAAAEPRAWGPVEGALLMVSAIFDTSLRPLVQRGVASDLLDLCVALASAEQCAAGPVRARACSTLTNVSVSIVDWVMGETTSGEAESSATCAALAPVGARCTAVLGAALRDLNKAVQVAAFEGLSQLVAHLETIAEDEDETEPLGDDEEPEGGEAPHPLLVLMPDDTFRAIYDALCANYASYQLVARSHLYELLAVTAEADRAYAQLRRPAGSVVLLGDAVRPVVLGGLASVWDGMGDLAPGADLQTIFESATLAACLGRIAAAAKEAAADFATPIAAKAITIVQGILANGSGANGRDAAADDTLVAAALCLLTSLCDAIGPELAFERLLSPELLAAAGSMCAAPLTDANAEAHKYAFALLGDFAATVGKAAATRAAHAANSGAAVDVPALLQEVAAPLLPHAAAVFGTVVRTLFAFSEDHLDAMTNTLWCCSQWVNAVPAAVAAAAFEEAGGLRQFMTMVAYFATNEGTGTLSSSPEFRENAVLLVARLAHMHPQHAAALVRDGLGAAFAVHVGKMTDPLERSDAAVRLGLCLQSGGGSADALQAAAAAGILVQPATDAAAHYAATFEAFAEQPKAVLKIAASVLSVTVKRSWDAQAKAATQVALAMWGGIAQSVLPLVNLKTKDARKGFTKKELTALGVA